ncbi:MAG: PVC-type heme-binding CxxCH protein [Planctomycetales bacterium]
MYRVSAGHWLFVVALALVFEGGTSPAFAEEKPAATGSGDWTPAAPREEIRPDFSLEKSGGRGGREGLVIRADARPGLMGYWTRTIPIEGGRHYRLQAYWRATNVPIPRRSINARLLWLDEHGKTAYRDMPVVGPYHPVGQPDLTTGEYPPDGETDAEGWTEVSGVYRAPEGARRAFLELHLEWAQNAEVVWSDVTLQPVDPPPPRPVRLATIHFVPSGKVSPADNCRQFAPLVAEAAKKRADLVVLPETLTHTGTGLTYAEAAEPVPGPSTDYFSTLARHHKLHLVVGLLERVEHVVYNVAVLIGPEGELIGKYRKVCLPRGEVEMGITPGTEYPVFDTRFGKVGMMICYDGFFPEVARELANRGAEVIAFPVAGCNPLLAAARACENHAYVVSSTYCGVQLNWMISGIYGHQGEVLAQATEWGDVAVTEVDLNRPTIWGNIGDYRAQLLRHRPATAEEQVRTALASRDDSRAAPLPASPRAQAPPAAGDNVEAPSLRIPPKEPAEAQKTFQALDGFRLDLLAAEPLTTDPIALDYDENGRAYVVEMSDYPYTDKTKDKPFTEKTADLPLGRVRLLEDTDGDGRFDKSTIFAEGLSWPTGLAIWQGGVYVAATPDLWYLKDTDGDRQADVRRKVFTGFHKFNVQAVINNLRWGLDHRLYGAGGTNGGTIIRLPDGESKPRKMAANDFRFDPHSEEFELISGGARFGHTFDDWGNRFTCNIRNPVRHAVLEDRYLSRNPLLAVSSPIHDAAEAGDTLPVFRTSPPEPWRVINARRLASDPTGTSPRSESIAAGYVTSTCGITIYRGSAYPPEYYGVAFLGEVAANLIHRQRLIPDGMTFRAERIDERVEFLTSTDNWFRPVNFVNAPDGTLHVLDMYRETIEHPWSIPDDIKARLDLESGRDRGRIYRLTPPRFRPVAPPRLGAASASQLVATLENPNSWWRDTAHRLLYERQDQAAVPPLRALLRKRTPPAPPQDSVGASKARRDESPARSAPQGLAVARLHALWSLEGLHALRGEDLLIALQDPTPGVREHAIRLAETRFTTAPTLREAVLALASDSELRVRCQVALSIGDTPDQPALDALAALARRDPDDPWMRIAVLSASPDGAAGLLETLCGGPGSVSSAGQNVNPQGTAERSAAPLAVIRSLAGFVGARHMEEEVRRALRLIAGDQTTTGAAPSAIPNPAFGREIMLGLSEGLGRHNLTLAAVAERLEPSVLPRLGKLARESQALAGDMSAAPAERIPAIALLGQGEFDQVRLPLLELLGSQQPAEVQLAAVQALARHPHPEIPASLLAAYRGLTPAVRTEVVHQLLSRGEWISAVLEALETRALAVGDIPLGRRAILLRNGNESIKARAAALFQREALGTRKEVVEEYRPALSLPVHADRGRQVSQKICQTCHRLGGQGQDVGPPLETIRHRSPEEVLLHVLDPNREVSPNYLDYVVVLKNGKTTTGVIAAETPTSVTLRRAEGAQETILRTDIEELSSSGKSIMPEGLEKQISVQEMADLLGFLLGGR